MEVSAVIDRSREFSISLDSGGAFAFALITLAPPAATISLVDLVTLT